MDNQSSSLNAFNILEAIREEPSNNRITCIASHSAHVYLGYSNAFIRIYRLSAQKQHEQDGASSDPGRGGPRIVSQLIREAKLSPREGEVVQIIINVKRAILITLCAGAVDMWKIDTLQHVATVRDHLIPFLNIRKST